MPSQPDHTPPGPSVTKVDGIVLGISQALSVGGCAMKTSTLTKTGLFWPHCLAAAASRCARFFARMSSRFLLIASSSADAS